jgi:hypothetical protein
MKEETKYRKLEGETELIIVCQLAALRIYACRPWPCSSLGWLDPLGSVWVYKYPGQATVRKTEAKFMNVQFC